MQVSDLDGTMVGDGPEADGATQAFCDYWENTAALAGGILVYNTGRSLGQFQELMQAKADGLAMPNALITAVGTKVGHMPRWSHASCSCGAHREGFWLQCALMAVPCTCAEILTYSAPCGVWHHGCIMSAANAAAALWMPAAQGHVWPLHVMRRSSCCEGMPSAMARQQIMTGWRMLHLLSVSTRAGTWGMCARCSPGRLLLLALAAVHAIAGSAASALSLLTLSRNSSNLGHDNQLLSFSSKAAILTSGSLPHPWWTSVLCKADAVRCSMHPGLAECCILQRQLRLDSAIMHAWPAQQAAAWDQV